MEELKVKGTDELCEWLGGQPEMKDKAGKLEKARTVIKEQDIDGDAFLTCTWEKWMFVGLPLGVAKTLVQIAERVKKEKYDGKRRYSEFFGEVFVSNTSMRLDSIPGLLSQEYKSNQDEEIEDDEEKDIDVEYSSR